MFGNRLRACLLLPLLLAGCASANPEQERCDIDFTQGSRNSNDDREVLFVITMQLVYLAGCNGMLYLERHFSAPHEGSIYNGVYRSSDGAFSVHMPGALAEGGMAGFRVREQLNLAQDHVFFVPTGEPGPLYSVSIIKQLEGPDASLSLPQFAALALKDQESQNRKLGGAPLQKLHEEDISLDGSPALFELYSQAPAAAGGPTAYYAMYFLKSHNRAAFLSVAWSGDCPKCVEGTEADVRAGNPYMKRFVESFKLAD
jgi:hypothetical protein